MGRVSRARVQRTLVLQLGRVLDAPVRFRLGFGWRDNDVSPMQYLKDLRLERASAELLGGSTHVAGVALRWGFGHLGRFSADYRARFGEYPSETVRRH